MGVLRARVRVRARPPRVKGAGGLCVGGAAAQARGLVLSSSPNGVCPGLLALPRALGGARMVMSARGETESPRAHPTKGPGGVWRGEARPSECCCERQGGSSARGVALCARRVLLSTGMGVKRYYRCFGAFGECACGDGEGWGRVCCWSLVRGLRPTPPMSDADERDEKRATSARGAVRRNNQIPSRTLSLSHTRRSRTSAC
jgi:hypothetical protein